MILKMIDNNSLMNGTRNITTDGTTTNYYEFIADGLLLPAVVFVIVFDLLVIAALIADSEIVRSIRWILANILAAGVVGALGSAFRHITQVIRLFANESLLLHGLEVCKTFLVVMAIGNGGRILMATFYAVTVFIVVKCWSKPVLVPRNTKYFIIGTVPVWILGSTLGVPLLVDEAVAATFCSSAIKEADKINGIISTMVFFLLSTIPVFLTLCFLVTTLCFIKRNTIRENRATKIALLKFGFFLIIGQGINAVAQIILPALFLVLVSHRDRAVIVTVLTAIFDLSLSTTPILISIFFKPVGHKLRKWFCSCCSRCSFRTTTTTLQDVLQPHIANIINNRSRDSSGKKS